ncbi:MAG: DUF3126 family protein [Alphaproteobacteria bacterium]|nr:DUF3126 family protein [Alphaproteobacteria bacterium]
MKQEEIKKLTDYLSKKFKTTEILLQNGQAKECVEVLLNGEFFGTLYRDEDDGEVSYSLTLSILDIDL